MKESSGKLIEVMHAWDELLLESGFDESIFFKMMKDHWQGLVEAIRPLNDHYKSLEYFLSSSHEIIMNPREAVSKRYEEAKSMLLRLNHIPDIRHDITIREIPKGIYTLKGANPHEYSKAVVDYYWEVEKATEIILPALALIYLAASKHHNKKKHAVKNKNQAPPVKEIIVNAFGTDEKFIKQHLDIILYQEQSVARTRIEVVEKLKFLPTNVEPKVRIPEGITMPAFQDLAEVVWAHYYQLLEIEPATRWNTYLRTSLGRENYPVK